MSQIAESRAERVPLGALVDRRQKDEVFRLAREQDCSVSRIVRKALAAEIERIHSDAGDSSRPPSPAELRVPGLSPAVEARQRAGDER
jgi:hypothetical protein